MQSLLAKTLNSYVFILLIVVLWCMGCVATKPDAFYASHPDYNSRISIDKAHYRTIATPVGTGFVLVGTVAGAYAGYSFDGGVVKQSGELREPVKPLNAVIGATLGYASTQLVLHLLGKNKSRSSQDAEKWLRDVSKSYTIIDKESEVDFQIIPLQAEHTFEVRVIDDVSGFYYAFPQSSRKDQIFMKGVENIQRSELPSLIDIDPNNQYRNDAVYKYYDLSKSVTELYEADDRYAFKPYPIEEKAASLVYTMEDLTLFQSRFGLQSKFNDLVFDQLYPVIEIQHLFRLIKQYPLAIKRKEAILRSISISQNLTEISTLLSLVDGFRKELEVKAEEIVFGDTYQIDSRYMAFTQLFPKSSRLHKVDGYNYLGDWDSKAKRPQGRGFMRHPVAKNITVGNFDKGRIEDVNGYYLSLEDGYKGAFSKGQFHGHGTYKYFGKYDHYTYTGEFKNGLEEGYGVKEGADVLFMFPFRMESKSATYSGYFAKGQPDGSGHVETKDGENWYKGGFRNGYFDGHGEMRLEMGVRIIGNFKEGRPHGTIEIKKWTLGGLVNSEVTVTAFSWSELREPVRQVLQDFHGQLFGEANQNNRSHDDYSSIHEECDIVEDVIYGEEELCNKIDVVTHKVRCKNGKTGYYYLNPNSIDDGWCSETRAGYSWRSDFSLGSMGWFYVGKDKVAVVKKICECN